MKIDVIQIGNSRGLRLPKAVMDQCGIEDRLELTIEDNRVILTPEKPLRDGWEKSFRFMRQRAEDQLVLKGLPPNSFDERDWEW